MIHKLWPFWATREEIKKVTNALMIAMHQHEVVAKVKTRKYTNEPYITHPIRVALSVATHPNVKLSWIAAALLHDTIEDTVYSEEEELALKHRITNDCGKDILSLVEELTNPKKTESLNRKQRKEQSLEKLKTASVPAKILKMFDRIDNLRDMVGAPVDFKKLYVSESEELFKVISDADKNIKCQLHSAIHHIYSWRVFTKEELEQKPLGTVFEYGTKGLFYVAEIGKNGCLKSRDLIIPFDKHSNSKTLIRETGSSAKSVEDL